MNRFANFLMFYFGWFACVAGAGRGALWAGPATAAVLLLAHLALAPHRVREGALVLIVGVFGFAVDTLQASAGLYAFSGTSTIAWLCPPWMTALWMLFAATLNGSMGWLVGRYRLAALLGALLGPLSYLAGERLGAITFSSDPLVGLGGIAIVWALVMPALLWIRETLSDASATAPSETMAAAPWWRRHRQRAGLSHGRVQPSRATRRIVGALVVILATARPGGAAEIEGVRFADRVRSGDVTLQLHCVGLLRYKVLIKAYVAALYLDDGTATDDVLADVPKRLGLNYFWSIDAADFGKAGDEILKRNVDGATFAALRPRLDEINVTRVVR